MDELVQRVREALAAEYPGAPNGRVRDVPDRRAIRWYTTIGLVDKPLGMRGRTALYGPRHLQQLVAIKRRQAEGRSLADIQVEFSWLAPQQLGELARVPDQLLAGHDEPVRDHSAGAARLRFWAEGPASADPAAADSATVSAGPTPSALTPSAPTLPASIPSAPDQSAPVPSTSAGSAPTLPAPAPSVPARSAVAEQMSAVPLGGGVILLLPGSVDDHDRDAIAAAATPLLTLLAVRGLTDGSSS
jgi:DNA-binding transcriptional MerR regulator